MTKVSLHQEAAASAAKSSDVIVTDEKGRKLTVKKISAIERMRLFKAIGGSNAGNQMYLGYATVAASVTAIDGEPVPFPATELQVEFLVQRLGDEGMDAAGQAIVENFTSLSTEEVVALAKK